jgi:hypothetical protein
MVISLTTGQQTRLKSFDMQAAILAYHPIGAAPRPRTHDFDQAGPGIAQSNAVVGSYAPGKLPAGDQSFVPRSPLRFSIIMRTMAAGEPAKAIA